MLYTSELKGNLTILTEKARVTLLPGTGELDDKEWDAIEDHPTIKELMESRQLAVLEEPKAKARSRSANPATTTPPPPA